MSKSSSPTSRWPAFVPQSEPRTREADPGERPTARPSGVVPAPGGPVAPRLSSLPPESRPRHLRIPQLYEPVRRLPEQPRLQLVRHRRTERLCVLQSVRRVSQRRDLEQRYARSSELTHPSTLRIVDAGILDASTGQGFVLRPWVAGESLQALARGRGGGACDRSEAIDLVGQLLGSLSEAHERGLVHGRLDLSHVLIESRPPGRVPELGSAAAEGEMAGRSREGDAAERSSARGAGRRLWVLGYWPETAARSHRSGECVAPELRPGGAGAGRGRAERPRATADVFAAGAILHRLLFGVPATPALGDEGLDHEPGRALPAQLMLVLRRALARDPEARFHSAGEMLRALSWARAGVAAFQDAGVSGQSGGPSALRQSGYEPRCNQLMSAQPKSIWVLDDGELLAGPELQVATSVLSSRYQLRELWPGERAAVLEQLRDGSLEAPWVILFGPPAVEAQDPLLNLLASCAELARVLVAQPPDFELLGRCISAGGLDQYVALPTQPEAILRSVETALARAARLRQHYDEVRRQLAAGRERVGASSRRFTAQRAR